VGPESACALEKTNRYGKKEGEGSRKSNVRRKTLGRKTLTGLKGSGCQARKGRKAE